MVRACHFLSHKELLQLPNELLLHIFLCFLPCLIDIVHVGRCNKKLATILSSVIKRLRDDPKEAAEAMNVDHLAERVYVDSKDIVLKHLFKYVSSNRVMKSFVVTGRNDAIGPEGAKALAPAIANSALLTTLKLSGNNLTNYGKDTSGVIAIAEALKANTSLTEACRLRSPLPILSLSYEPVSCIGGPS